VERKWQVFTEAAIPFWTALGSVAAALAVIGGFVGWLYSQRKATAVVIPGATPTERPQLMVRRVIDPDDPDLPAAYDIYSDGITNESERDSFPEIQRWLFEAKRARASGKAKLDEYLLIAKVGSKVAAFFYGQYYESHRMFLIGYSVIDRKSKDARRATSMGLITFMFDALKGDHPACQGIVFELALEPGRNVKARIGKEELFAVHARTAAGLVLKRLDVEYFQPKLSLWDPELTEERQHLIYGRLSGEPLGASIPKPEAAHILDAVYNCWYGDYYEDDPVKDREYRSYVRGMCERTVSDLPDPVPLL
jgi:hypothetical protein